MSEQIKENMEANEKQKGKKKWLLLLLLLLVLLMAAGGYVIYQKYYGPGTPNAVQKELSAELGIMPGMTEDEIRDRLNRKVEEGRFSVSINGLPVFKNGKSEGNVQIENIPGNRYSFTVEIVVESVDQEKYPQAAAYVGQKIMSIGLMDPGSYLLNKKLDVDLPAGEYVCLAQFTAYKPDEVNAPDLTEMPEPVGVTNAQIVITVES